MMIMLRNLGLMICVVCIAAFASGCGGGGGSTDTTDPPVMEGPTDEERIVSAKNTLAGIVADARTREQAARSAAAAVEGHADATEEQKANARSFGDNARDALTDIVGASATVNTATTGAQAEGAVSEARAALSDLISAQSSVASIQSAVDAVANARRQQEEDARLATNGSSLIQHVRDNKIVFDGVLNDLGRGDGPNADPLVVGDTDADNLATYDADDTTTTPRVVGVREVTAEGITSDDTTTKLSGTGRLPHGFDLKEGTKYVNVYTDITKTRKDVPQRRTGDNTDTTDTEEYNHVYSVKLDEADTDYLIAGIWLDGNVLKAFAYGSQPLGETRNQGFLECLGVPTNAQHTCTNVDSFTNIADFVDDGKEVKATYRGDANGAYLASGAMSYFEADVTLNAEFLNPTDGADSDNNGSIEGAVTNIVAGGKSIAGSIELQEHTFENAIGAAFGGEAIGVVAGKSYSGDWKGQFFGQRVSSARKTEDRTVDPVTSVTTFSAQAPDSVAGTFYVKQQSAPAGSAAFIGSFGAKR